MGMKNLVVPALALLCYACGNTSAPKVQAQQTDSASKPTDGQTSSRPALDTARYNSLLTYMTNGDTTGLWPVKHEYPLPGAILPFNRVVAYYGNLYSNRMGALGKWPKKEMISNLLSEVKKWTEADSTIPSIPALHYIS